MRTVKFILGWSIVTCLLLISVVTVNALAVVLRKFTVDASATSGLYETNTLLWGFVSDALRALFLCYLFPQLKLAGSALGVAIKFGLTISAIMATLWLIVGYSELKLEDPNYFLLYDGLIFAVQGILSGLGLHWIYNKHFIT